SPARYRPFCAGGGPRDDRGADEGVLRPSRVWRHAAGFAHRRDRVTQASARIIMRVAELWRYPVKSLAGERLDGVEVTAAGMAGDRIVQVRNGRDRVITSRTAPRLLALRRTWNATAGGAPGKRPALPAPPG